MGTTETIPMAVGTGSSTVKTQDPYTIGTVDTAFKLF